MSNNQHIYKKYLLMENYEREHFNLHNTGKYVSLRKKEFMRLRKNCMEALAALYKDLNNSNEARNIKKIESKMNKELS